jgi:glycosyltransferase involved in cell wall biosynthesis
MRIAIATEVHAPKIDGISTRLAHTVRELCASGHEVLTLTPAPAEPACDGERLFELPGVRFPLYPDVVMGAPDPRIVRELARFRPHVLHAVGPVAVGFYALLAARALAIPSVASYHTALPEYAARYGYPELEGAAWRLLRAAHALAPVLEELPGVRLAFVGDGPERARLERTYRKLPVHFVGALTGEELAAAYASADVFVMPSTTETLGFVALEAMASGLPVVAADAGGVRDLVAHEETGFLFDPAESKGALEPIRRLLGSPALAASVARSARAAAERCSWGVETRALAATYELAMRRAERRSLRVKLRSFLDG